MRIKLIFSDEFNIGKCWFGLDPDKTITVADLIRDLSVACDVGSITLEMDGFILLDDGEISVLLRDGDVLIVQRAHIKSRKRTFDEISTERSLAVNIKLEKMDDIAMNEDQLDNQQDQSTFVAGIEEDKTEQTDHIIQQEQSVIGNSPQLKPSDSISQDLESESLEEGEIIPLVVENDLVSDMDQKVKSENEEELMIPVPQFRDEDFNEAFAPSNAKITTISYTRETKFRIDGLREKGIMYFEEIQKGGWMEDGGNTMDWKPPETSQGWNVNSSKSRETERVEKRKEETSQGWNVNSSKSRETERVEKRKDSDWREINTSNQRKSRFDSEAFNRESLAKENEQNTNPSECTCLFWNMNQNVMLHDIKNTLLDWGRIKHINFTRNKDQKFTGEGYVEFSSSNEAKRACKLDGKAYIKGSKLRIQLAPAPISEPVAEKSEKPREDLAIEPNPVVTEQHPGYCKITGLCKPIKISIFHSFLLKSGGKVAFSNDSNEILICFKTHLDMESIINDYSGKSLVGTNPKSCSNFQVISEHEFAGLKNSATDKIYAFCVEKGPKIFKKKVRGTFCMTENIQNLAAYDPFADTGESEDLKVEGYIHIRIQQRNGRKTLTTVQGLPADLDPKKILKAFKKDFACNGSIVNDEEMGNVIQLQGDQRAKVATFLAEAGIVAKNKIKIHGF